MTRSIKRKLYNEQKDYNQRLVCFKFKLILNSKFKYPNNLIKDQERRTKTIEDEKVFK